MIFELVNRGEKALVRIVSDCTRNSLVPVIKGLIMEQSRFTRTAGKAYDDLVLNGYEHYRVFHSENEARATSTESRTSGASLRGG